MKHILRNFCSKKSSLVIYWSYKLWYFSSSQTRSHFHWHNPPVMNIHKADPQCLLILISFVITFSNQTSALALICIFNAVLLAHFSRPFTSFVLCYIVLFMCYFVLFCVFFFFQKALCIILNCKRECWMVCGNHFTFSNFTFTIEK